MKKQMMKKSIQCWMALAVLAFAFPMQAWSVDTTTSETPEIQFSSAVAVALNTKAQELNSPVAIYEYLRNNHEYALYQGSRSGSVNTLLGMRGNDVDLASTMIAMFRAPRGVPARVTPARYAVSTVRMAAPVAMNWLGVQNADLAASIMKDQGIQAVVLSTDKSTIDFEHTWVEVLLPYNNYRGSGAEAQAVDCVTTPASCHWISLDPSFKQHAYNGLNIDPYLTLTFDYTAYYNAIKNNDVTRMNKNPLEIYQEQVLGWLRTNYPGKTLEDVADVGAIIPENNGILPASLPYGVVGAVRRYNSVADHDLAETVKWAKYLTLNLFTQLKDVNGTPLFDQYNQPLQDKNVISAQKFLLVDLATQQLTVTFESGTVACAALCAVVRKGQVVVPLPAQPALTLSEPLIMGLALDGSPSALTPISATYYGIKSGGGSAGGYYLIGTGGFSSNWSQVHRAADNLLAANQQYPILNNAAGVPYVDSNGNGVIDAGEPRLLDNKPAMDALTGGLLYVAMSQYFAKFSDGLNKLDHLNHVITPIDGFVGVVSSMNDVQYVAGTAFSILPGGLLIDMKGQRLSGTWRLDTPATSATKHFELVGHIMSSYEHEIWQELTGYDAVSTVRGIQMALTNIGSSLVNPKNVAGVNNWLTEYPKLHFGSSPGLTYTAFNNLFLSGKSFGAWGTTPTWRNYQISMLSTGGYGDDQSFEMLLKAPSTSVIRQGAYKYTFFLTQANSIFDWLTCYQQRDTYLYYLANGSTTTGSISGCNGTVYSGYVYNDFFPNQSLWHQIKNEFLTWYLPRIPTSASFLSTTGFDPLVPTDYMYHGANMPAIYDNTGLALSLRDNLYKTPGNEYLIPSERTQTGFNAFTVYVAKRWSGTNLVSQAFIIENWGGGYVPLQGAVLTPSTSIAQAGATAPSILPTFNNATFNDMTVVSAVNNNLLKTPSTADPVSTVTGNNYHDETDITIKGRGLNIAFTRTYNSTPSASKTLGPLGYGCTHSYAMKLKSNDFGACPNCGAGAGPGLAPENGNNKTSSITYTDERGGDHNYLVNETTFAVTPPQGEFDTLAFDTPVAGQHTITFRNGTQYIFEGPSTLKTTPNVTARLKTIQDAYGNQLNFGYDASGRLSSVTDNLAIAGRTGLTFSYIGAATQISSIADWSGRAWSFGYDAANNLVSVTNPLAKTLQYTYAPGTGTTASHNLKDVILPELRNGLAVKTTFAYYQNGKTFNYQNALAQSETLDYDLYRKTTRVTDPRGGIRQYQYDSSGRMTKLIEPDGAELLFENSPDGLRNKKYDGLGYATAYSYRNDKALTGASDTSGNVTREQAPLGFTLDYAYGPFDQIASVKDKLGRITSTTYYTAAGTCAVIGKPNTISIATLNGALNVALRSYCWNPDGTLASQKDFIDATRFRTTSYTYQPGGLNVQAVTITGYDGSSTNRSYTYDSLGRKITETLARRISATNPALANLTTSYQYDALDRITRVTDALGNIAETVYDANGQTKQLNAYYKKADGTFITRTLVTRSYDQADRMTSESDVYANTNSYAYDNAGNVIRRVDANGHITRFEYDAMNRRTAVIDANGYRTTTTYDLAGHPVAVTNPNGKIIRTSYDALGRITQVTTPLGYLTQFSVDANNNVTGIIDANAQAGLQPKNLGGNTVTRQYDELGRLIAETDALNGITRYSYDLAGNLTSLTDASGKVTTNVYDGLGRLTTVIDPLIETPVDKVVSYSYDEAGNPITKTDRLGKVTRTSYDALNRATLSEYLSDATTETIVYDIYGNRYSVANGAVTYSYTYDLKNRMLSKTDSRLGKSISYTYDKVGNIQTKTDYQNDTTTYEYDATNRLVAESNPAYLSMSYQYDGASRLLGRILSNNARTSYGWDDDDRLTSLTSVSASGTVVSNASYTRDRVGNILSTTDLDGLTTYTYDPLYRLTTAAYPNIAFNESFIYDAVGNRLTHTQGTAVHAYEYVPGSNRLKAIHTGTIAGAIEKSFTYNDEGQLIAQTGTSAKTIAWDQKGRPTSITPSGKAANTFGYDPMDRRISKFDSNGSQSYLLEGDHLEAIYSGYSLLAKYMRGAVIDEVVNGYQNDKAGNWTNYTFHHDRLQSVLGLSGHQGTVLATQSYTAFGESRASTGTSNNNLKYTGRELDNDSGCYQYRARYYDSATGRFLSEDPKGFAAGVNFFAYTENNPVNANDPSGLEAFVYAAPRAQGGFNYRAFDDNGSKMLTGTFNANTWVNTQQLPAGSYTVSPRPYLDTNYLQQAKDLIFGDRNAHAGRPTISNTGNWNTTVFPDGSTHQGIEIHPGRTADGGGVSLGCLVCSDAAYGQINALFQKNYDDGGVNLRVLSGSMQDAFPSLKITPNVPAYQGMGGGSSAPLRLDTNFGSMSDIGGAAGGFLLYPNKPNTNQMQSVYSK